MRYLISLAVFLAAQLGSCSVERRAWPLSCPPCYTATQHLYVPCPLRIPTCTGPSSPIVSCTSTVHVWSTSSREDNPWCPTLTSLYPCPTQTPCNEVGCAVETVVHREPSDGNYCTACPASQKTTRTMGKCPKATCRVAQRPCEKNGEENIVTTATTTMMSGCETVVWTGVEPCPTCGACIPRAEECSELATTTMRYCRPHSCPAIRRKCDEHEVESFVPSGTVTSVYTSDCTVFSVTGPSPCPPCATCYREQPSEPTAPPEPTTTGTCGEGEGVYYSNLCPSTALYACGNMNHSCQEGERPTPTNVRSTEVVVNGCRTIVHTAWDPCPGCDECWEALPPLPPTVTAEVE